MKTASPAFFHPVQSELDWTEILSLAQANGGDFADIFWERSDSTEMAKRDKKIEALRQGTDEGVGIRVMAGTQTVYGYTNELTAQGVRQLAKRISEGVRGVLKSRVPLLELRAERGSTVLSLAPDQSALKEKLSLMDRVEDRAWAHSPSVKQVAARYLDCRRQVLLARSDGWVSLDDKSYITMRLMLTGEGVSGMQTALDQIGGFWGLENFKENTPEALADKVGRQLDVLLKAVPAPSGPMPVVLGAQAGGTMVHEAVGHGLEADLAMQGLSVYAGREGQRVASPKITVVDDGTLKDMRGTHTFDDEGTPMQKTVLVEEGVLKSFMFDQKMALRTGRKSTGNGRRESYRFAPMVRMTNTFIAPGNDRAADILKDTPWGLYVAQVGGGQVDTVSGNFVFGVQEAYLIRNGQLAEPVCGATLTGNGPEVLKIVDRVGGDLGWANGTCGKVNQHVPVSDAQPTMRVPSLNVGGTVPLTKYFSDR